jgi:hypothetical protein
MKVRGISTYGYQLTRIGLFNMYLVRESDSFTLIDTGLAGSAPRVVEAAHRIAAEPIERLLLTHAHGDHIGSLDKLSAALGRADVAIGRREARLLPKKPAQDRSLNPSEPQCKVKGSFPGAETAPTHLLEDGELYGSLRVVATPGHTPGHVSYFDERDGTLYAGDALGYGRGQGACVRLWSVVFSAAVDGHMASSNGTGQREKAVGAADPEVRLRAWPAGGGRPGAAGAGDPARGAQAGVGGTYPGWDPALTALYCPVPVIAMVLVPARALLVI